MRLSEKQLRLVRDFAINFSIDNSETLCYPISNNWIYGLVEVLKREGYAVLVKRSSDLTDSDDILEWVYPEKLTKS
jgi:hypothetical protein